MKEFRIESDEVNRRRLIRRNTVWTTVAICSPLLTVAVLLSVPGTPHLRVIIPVMIFAVCAGLFYGTAQLGRERRELDTVYALTEREIIRRRNGWPDDRILFNEIRELSNTRRYLVIKSADPLIHIAVPKGVENYPLFLRELEERCDQNSSS